MYLVLLQPAKKKVKMNPNDFEATTDAVMNVSEIGIASSRDKLGSGNDFNDSFFYESELLAGDELVYPESQVRSFVLALFSIDANLINTLSDSKRPGVVCNSFNCSGHQFGSTASHPIQKNQVWQRALCRSHSMLDHQRHGRGLLQCARLPYH